MVHLHSGQQEYRPKHPSPLLRWAKIVLNKLLFLLAVAVALAGLAAVGMTHLHIAHKLTMTGGMSR